MVRPGARRGDDNLGPVTDMTCRVEGRTVTASSRVHRSLLPNHIYQLGSSSSPSHRPHTPDDQRDHDDDDDNDDDSDDAEDEEEPVPVAPASSFGGRPRLGKDKGLTDSFMLVMSKISGSCNKRPNKAPNVLTLTQRKKAKSSYWEQRGPAEGGPVDLVLIPSYDMWHVDLCICSLVCSSIPTQHYYRLLWRGGRWTPTCPYALGVVDVHYSRGHLIVVIQSDLGITYTGGGRNGQELFDIATDMSSRLSSGDKAACYIQYLLGSSLFPNKSGNICMGCCDTCLLIQEPWSGLAC
ncbi:hypothetical protein M9H77_35320 [Catharanthus roseus]|uniref:Uncharacterized protein n=1 Tax=Catharanthus roseus TaxID=4058 RepID=A0ACB9ZSC3_CATRO|nr:hypothetical protein M9H77_35320 [Catharanthus roseus]